MEKTNQKGENTKTKSSARSNQEEEEELENEIAQTKRAVDVLLLVIFFYCGS